MHTPCVQGKVKQRQVRPVVRFNTGSLADLIHLVNNTPTPSTFDLCGQKLRHVDATTNITISANDVSIRNGTIHLADSAGATLPSLFVSGTGVEMDHIKICGGCSGVGVSRGASITMQDCTLEGLLNGMHTDPPGLQGMTQPSIVAHGLKIFNCTAQSVGVGLDTSVELTDCVVSDHIEGHSIVVLGCLHATRVACMKNAGLGLHAGSAAKVVFMDSTISFNESSTIHALQGSSVQLVRCTAASTSATTPKGCVTTSQLQVGNIVFMMAGWGLSI